jgi:hypothetical protein
VPKLAKASFSACASFGPIMLAMGSLFPNRDGTPYGLIITIPGAMMTTAALLIVFRSLTSLETSTSSSENSIESKDGDAA